MGEYPKSRVLNGETCYQILREIVQTDEGSYAAQIARDLDRGRTDTTRAIRAMKTHGILKQGKRTKSQYYILDPEGLIELLSDLWDEDIRNNELLNRFIKEYTETYISLNEDSTIRKMLYSDFFQGLEIEKELRELPDFLDEIYLTFDDKYEGKRGPDEPVHVAIEEVDN